MGACLEETCKVSWLCTQSSGTISQPQAQGEGLRQIHGRALQCVPGCWKTQKTGKLKEAVD